MIKLDDPVTKKPAMRNPFYTLRPGTLLVDDMAIDKLMAKGVIFGACNVALHVLSGSSPPTPASRRTRLQGVDGRNHSGHPMIPSGTWGVNRAQEAGCTYCTGGGI